MGRLARRLNAFPQFRTTVDGVAIHHLHVRSEDPDAVPLLLSHGWPGSIVEFLDVVEPLSRRFHLVVPSLPGYGWRDAPRPAETGVERIGEPSTDSCGSSATPSTSCRAGTGARSSPTTMGIQAPAGLRGIHVDLAISDPSARRPARPHARGAAAGREDPRRPPERGRLLDAAEHEAADHRLRTGGLPRRPARLDRREVRGLDRPRRRPRGRRPARRPARRRHGLLADEHRDVVRSSVPGALRGGAQQLRRSPSRARTRPTPATSSCSERSARTRYVDLRHYRAPARGGHFAALWRGDEFAAEVTEAMDALRA